MAYKQALRLFECWCMEEMKIMIVYQKEKEQGGFLHPKKIWNPMQPVSGFPKKERV